MANSGRTFSEYLERLEEYLNKREGLNQIKRFDNSQFSDDLKPIGKGGEKVIENTPKDYINLYKNCWSLKQKQRPTLDNILSILGKLSVEITIEFVENKIVPYKQITRQKHLIPNTGDYYEHSILSSGFLSESRVTLSSDFSSGSYNTPISNSSNGNFSNQELPFDTKRLDDTLNLFNLKLWIESEGDNLPRESLIDILESLSVAPKSKIYEKHDAARLELRLRTLKATLEKAHFPILDYEFRDALLNNLKTYIDLHYDNLDDNSSKPNCEFCPNYNINFLLIHLRDTLQSIRVAGIQTRKFLNKDITAEITIHEGFPMPPSALEFIRKTEEYGFNYTTECYKKWCDLLTVYHSLDISAKQQSDGFLQHHKEAFLLEFLWRYDTVIKEELRKYCDSQYKFLIDVVYRKLQLENELKKPYIKDYDVSIFQEKSLTREIVPALKDIIKEKLICPISKQLIGDFSDLKCGHTINFLVISNQTCPFCKVEIESIYNFMSNGILKGFYEKLNDFNNDIINEQKLGNIPSNFMLLKMAKDAEEQKKYSDVISYLNQVMRFYPKSYSYSIQCWKANAFWKLGLSENPETAIKHHIKARDILTSAIKLKPKKSLAYIYKSQIYLYYSNSNEALKNLKIAQKFEPNNTFAFLYKILVSNEKDAISKPKEVQHEFNCIVYNKKFNPISIVSLLTTNKPRKKIFGLGNSLPTKLYSLDDSTISGYVFFCKIFQNFKKAIRCCTQAIKLNDRNAVALGIRGISYHKKKLFSNALKDFNQVLDILPNNKFALGWRGKIYSSMKDYDKSLDDLSKAIHSNSESSNN
ncbi:36594_t:CDS:2, partial [Racocetra persica]